jgi:hypothetical protein
MRDHHKYDERKDWVAPEGYGHRVDQPVAGFYKIKSGRDMIVRAVHIVFAPPNDPLTGEVLDRSWRWQAILDTGELIPFDTAWPNCAGAPISEQDFRCYVNRTEWARQNAPDSAYADRRKRHDPLAATSPLPF